MLTRACLLLLTLLLYGCLNKETSDSELPWNRPAVWELNSPCFGAAMDPNK